MSTRVDRGTATKVIGVGAVLGTLALLLRGRAEAEAPPVPEPGPEPLPEPKPVAYTLTLAKSPSEGGSVTGAGTYDPGAEVVIEAVANRGWEFKHWQGTTFTSVSKALTITMDANKTIAAVFAKVEPATPPGEFTLGTGINPPGSGGVTPPQGYPSGSVATVQAFPNVGWQFSHWSGDASGTANPTSVTMDRSKSVMANFVQVEEPGVAGIQLKAGWNDKILYEGPDGHLPSVLGGAAMFVTLIWHWNDTAKAWEKWDAAFAFSAPSQFFKLTSGHTYSVHASSPVFWAW